MRKTLQRMLCGYYLKNNGHMQVCINTVSWNQKKYRGENYYDKVWDR